MSVFVFMLLLKLICVNLFAGHQPHRMATWSYRTETNGDSIRGSDESPDVECLWVNLHRHTQMEFSFSYNYPSFSGGECVIEPGSLLNTTVIIPDMPETVLLGLAVSTAVSPPLTGSCLQDLQP